MDDWRINSPSRGSYSGLALVILGLFNGLSTIKHQAITSTNDIVLPFVISISDYWLNVRNFILKTIVVETWDWVEVNVTTPTPVFDMSLFVANIPVSVTTECITQTDSCKKTVIFLLCHITVESCCKTNTILDIWQRWKRWQIT